MDKAKQLAEQAQQKLDEAQKQFNQGGSTQGAAPSGNVRYDEHGRPVEGPPAGTTQPPSAEPVDAGPAPEASEPAAGTPAPDKPAGDGANASPDPFKPIQ